MPSFEGTPQPIASLTTRRLQYNIGVDSSGLAGKELAVSNGSGVNGYWTKWADGRMTCTHTISATADAWTTATGSLFVSSVYTWTFPQTFVGDVTVAPVPLRNSAIAAGGNLATLSGTAVTFYMWSSVSLIATTSKAIYLTANGRWF